MGSIMSAINDDEDEWEQLVQKANVYPTQYLLYSKEARRIEEKYSKGLTGLRLLRYVELYSNLDQLSHEDIEELREKEQLKVLMKKYPQEKI